MAINQEQFNNKQALIGSAQSYFKMVDGVIEKSMRTFVQEWVNYIKTRYYNIDAGSKDFSPTNWGKYINEN